jgi:general secretion pathway protein C
MELNADKLVSLEFLPAGVRTQVVQKSPAVLMFLLVIMLAYQMAGFTWAIVESYFVQPSQQALSPVEKVSAKQQSSSAPDYAQLANLHLFGKQDESKVVAQAPETAPETRLALVLYGVFTDQDAKTGSAIIGPKSGQQQYYSVGDRVDTGVWLAEVRADHVLLRTGASYEALKFPKQSSDGFSIKDSASIQDSKSSSSSDLSENKQSFMENVKIVPVFTGKDRALKGYRILPKKDRTVYNRLGLRPSDIVTSINGIALNDQREAMRVINELVKSDQVEVQLDRNGQLETKVLNLK